MQNRAGATAEEKAEYQVGFRRVKSLVMNVLHKVMSVH